MHHEETIMHAFIIAPANHPGSLADTLDGVAQRGVNITSVGGGAWGDTGVLAFQCDDDEGARAALQESGTAFREAAAVTVWLEHRPGTFAEACRALGNAGVNIEAVLPVGMQDGKVGVLFGVDNEDAAKAALGL
jgi:hypothetical protein